MDWTSCSNSKVLQVISLRGDMVAKQSSMKNNLSKAQDAIDRGDSTRAKKYADLAQGDVRSTRTLSGEITGGGRSFRYVSDA